MLKNKIKLAVYMLSGTMMMQHARILCFAGGEAESEANELFDISFLEKQPEDGGIFAEIIQFCKELGASTYALIAVVGMVLCVISLSCAGFKFFRGGRHKDEAMDMLGGIAIGGALIFGAVSIVSCYIAIIRH